MKRMTVSLAAALLALSAGVSSAQDQKVQGPTEGAPAAYVDFSGGSVGLGIGYTWVHGILHFKGMDYPFTANGLDLANVGASSVTGSASVYELTRIEDFPGTYTGIGAGATVAGGGAAVALQNQKGVVMQVLAKTQGLQVAVAASGLSVALSGPPVPATGGAVGSSTPTR